MEPQQDTIQVKNLGIQFDDEYLLKGINLQLQKGEVFVIIGPSGQGKSVFLKMLAGILQPTEGEVLIEGQNLYALKEAEKSQLMRKMGMLFQKNALFDSLTSSENIAFPLREVTNCDEAEINKRINFFLEAVAIPHARDLYPDEISGGMQKRLGIARALALYPEIIFYDDPTAGLDPTTSRKIIQLIIDLQKQENPRRAEAKTGYYPTKRLGKAGMPFIPTCFPEALVLEELEFWCCEVCLL